MTADDPRYPVYRPRAVRAGGPGVGLLAIVAGLAYLAPGAWAFALAGSLVLLALFVGGYLRARGSATITGPGGITARRPPGARTIPWPEIQVVDIESQAVWTAQAREPRRAVVVYDAQGRRTPLPTLDSRQVPELEAEMRRLRALWERERGPAWTPVEGLRRRTTEVRGNLLMAVLLLAALAFCVIVSVLVIRADGPIVAVLLFGVFPVLAMVTALVVLTLRRR